MFIFKITTVQFMFLNDIGICFLLIMNLLGFFIVTLFADSLLNYAQSIPRTTYAFHTLHSPALIWWKIMWVSELS
mgnify:CR=1 FL=1